MSNNGHTREKTAFKSVTRGQPCQLCEGVDGCSVGADGLCLCRRRDGVQPGFVFLGDCRGDGQWKQYRREGDPLLADSSRGSPFEVRAYGARPQSNGTGAASHPKIDWSARAEECRQALTPDLRRELAESIGLPEAVIDALRVGRSETDAAWTFPEADGTGRIIGVNRRYRDGSKKAMAGGSRGLTVPAGWQDRDGPIYLPEGSSDTLALAALGLSSIGRPSNTGGVEHLVHLLRDAPADRQIIVLGELDANDKGLWPGRDGAQKTAAELQHRLNRPVYWALPPDKMKDVRAWTQSRQLPLEGEGTADDWQAAGEDFAAKINGRIIKATPKDLDDVAKEHQDKAENVYGFRLEPIDSAAMDAEDYRPEWLILNVLVARQPCIIGGPQKVLKTTATIDLAISLASATPFLGTFQSPVRRRVLILSGESGGFTLQETARRVCKAKGIDLAGLGDWLLWQFTLPQLANILHLEELRIGLKNAGVEVVIIDPLYLSLLSGSNGAVHAENLYEVGPLLLRVAQACLSAGATPILLHHTKKNAGREGDPLELTDLAFSGIAEFARQWLLLSRRKAYAPGTGHHELWMGSGGSVGHGGLWALDIHEGVIDDSFGGRSWAVTVQSAAEARAAAKEAKKDVNADAKADANRNQTRADEGALLAALDKLSPDRAPVGCKAVQAKTDPPLSDRRMRIAFERLLSDGIIVRHEVEIAIGNKGKRKAAGMSRRTLHEAGDTHDSVRLFDGNQD